MYQNIIKTLSGDDYYKIKKDIDRLINDQSFIKTIITVHNPIVFDRFIKMCEFKVDTSVLYEKRNKFIKKTIINLSKNSIFDFFELDTIDKSRSELIANRYLTEYIISYYFGDNYYNFLTNFQQMIRYLNEDKKTLVSDKNIAIYNKFVDLKEFSFDDKVKLFEEYLNVDLMGIFYNDINTVREDSHKELVKRSLKLDRDSNIYRRDLSSLLNMDIYYLNGSEFYAFVKVLPIKRDDLSNGMDYINYSSDSLGYSFSYISDKNIGTIDSDGKNITLFYDDIDYKNIMYVHHADLHAKKMKIQDDYLSNKENEVFTPNDLIKNTNNYNEIYIKNDKLKPSALVCYDGIIKEDVLFAKKYNLPILIINREKYKRFETWEDEYDSYTYVI